MSRSVLGERQAATSVRPAVREAARLCIEAQRSPLNVPDMQQLRRLAIRMNMQPHGPHVQSAALCRSFESALGNEWR